VGVTDIPAAITTELVRLRAENARLLRSLKLTPQQAAPPGPAQAAYFEAPPGMVHDGSPPDANAVVASTGKLPAGTYYVSATAWLSVNPGDSAGYCYISTVKTPGTAYNEAVGIEATDSVAETAAVTITAGDSIVEVCYTMGSTGSTAPDAGIIATRVLSSNPHAVSRASRTAARHGSCPKTTQPARGFFARAAHRHLSLSILVAASCAGR
jgi:hypothetical protein